MDREMLLTGAEEVYSSSRAKTLVFDEDPGNFADVAMEIEQMRRARGRFARKEKEGSRRNSSVASPKMNKPHAPYVRQAPFRSGGAKLLYAAWLPRAKSVCASGASGDRWRRRLHEPEMEGVASHGCPSEGRTMVSPRCPLEMEGRCPATGGSNQSCT